MVVLGLDPGIATVGFGLIDIKDTVPTAIRYGVIKTSAGLPLSARLAAIYEDVNSLIRQFKPDVVTVEELFFNTNLKTGISVAHGRGVLLLAAYENGIPVHEYTPLQVKQSVVGYGRADKKQVMEMVKRLLKLEKIPRPDDAADALAIALCHARAATSLLYKEWSKNECSTT
ncbi:MAG: crossover junction endodeoxyribonuclease RuvC [Clostridiales bacterium]|nr:crossover junction endodeoxyribonuclease RuvC [Clostridiales bacterium]